MTTRGRKPDQTETAPNALTAVPDPPETLEADGREEWHRAADDLVQRGGLTPGALATLHHYCLAVARARAMEREIARLDSPFVQSDRSAPRMHPAYREMDNAVATARQLAGELCLTPAGRAKLKTAPPDEADGWDGLLGD